MDDITTSTTSTNPLMSLPPELRNTIWDLVLPEKKDRLSIFSFTRGTYSKKYHGPRDYHFLEPAVLSVCKAIRNELLPIIYLGCPLVVGTRSFELDKPCEWLNHLSQQLGGRWPDFTMYIMAPEWEDMETWFSLVKFGYEYDDGSGADSIQCSRRGRLMVAFKELFAVGVQAKEDGASVDQLQAYFDDWLSQWGEDWVNEEG